MRRKIEGFRFAAAAAGVRKAPRAGVARGTSDRPAVSLLTSLVLLTGVAVACGPERGTIGALLGQSSDQRLVLREVPADLAAGKAGLQPGDELILIDGRDVRDLDERGVHQALSGNVGDPVKLTLLREGRVIRVTLRRTALPKKG
jgi:predicted metalloprotease with PDZ domain